MPSPEDVLQTARELKLDATLHDEVGAASTAQQAADALGVQVDRIAKSILLVIREEAPVLVLVPGQTRVDLEKVATEVRASPNAVRLATPEEVLEHTGFEVGAVPPVGLTRPIRVLLDRGVGQGGALYVGAGSTEAMLEMEGTDLRKLPDVTLGDFAEDR